MISDPIILGLFIAPFYSIVAPILAFLYCRRRFHISAGHIGLGVAAAIVSETVFGLLPLHSLIFELTPHGWAPHFKLFGSAISQNAWVVFLHQALRYAFFRFLFRDDAEGEPGIAYGIGFAGYTCLGFACGGWLELSQALSYNAVNVLAALEPEYRDSFGLDEAYFWVGIPLGTQAVANLLLEIGLGALAWRALRLRSFKLFCLVLVFDFIWRVPMAIGEAYHASYYRMFCYEWLGLVLALGFLFYPLVAKGLPKASLRSNGQTPRQAASDQKTAGLFAVWRNQTLKDEDV